MTKAEAAKPKLQITDERRKVVDLTVDPKNARRHSEQQIAKIIASIEEFGYVNKVAIQPNDTIIGGHATIEALKRLGHEEIDVRVVAGLSERQYQRLGIALNRIPEDASWDFGILADIIGPMKEAGDDLGSTGMSDAEIDRILAGDKPIEVKEIETGDVNDEFWISVRGPLAQQADALRALETALKPFAGVSVDIGTIAINTEG